MLHIIAGYDRSTAHPHDTVAEARECELWSLAAEEDHAAGRAEVAAERANEAWFEHRGGFGYAGSRDEHDELRAMALAGF